MTTDRRSWGLALGTSLVLCLSLPLTAAAEAEGEGSVHPQNAISPLTSKPSDLLGPIAPVLSTSTWLLAKGLDPRPAFATGGEGVKDAATTTTGERTQAAGAGAPVPYREPGPAFSRNILITRDFSNIPFQTEPSLKVDPNDPDHLVVGVIDYAFPANTVYTSFDGGERWDGPFQVPSLVDDLGVGGDPVMAFDSDSNVYMSYISIGVDDFALGPLEISTEVSSIAIARSEDDGYTWPTQISASRSRVDAQNLTTDRFGRVQGTVDISFFDKPWLVSGPSPDDPGSDVLYATYTNFDTSYGIVYIGDIPNLVPAEMRSTIELVRSTDGGQTWTEPVAVSPTVRQAYGEQGDPSGAEGVFGTQRVVQGSQPVVAPDGTVHVAWMDSTDDKSQEGVAEIQVATSSDAGVTFSDPVVASVFNEPGFRPRTSNFRFWASAFPQIASGPDGEIYITYVGRPPDRPNDDGDVFLIRSTDDGQTWTRPRVLNGDDTDHLQFFPSIDVSPDGVIHVMWGDFRDSPSQSRYYIYYTRSEDGGDTFGFTNDQLGLSVADTRVSDYASNPNYAFPGGLFIGDYFSLAATDEDVHMVWADARLGEFGPANQKIAVARTSAVDAPELFINPPSGPGGQQVTLQGFAYQPEMPVYVQLGDSIISQLRTNTDGEFTAQIYMPITSEGSQTVTVYDDSGNGASTSFYTEFGFGNIADRLDELAKRIADLESGSGTSSSGS